MDVHDRTNIDQRCLYVKEGNQKGRDSYCIDFLFICFSDKLVSP